MSEHTTQTVTVGDLRRWLEGFDPDAPIVVPCGIGYEHPKVMIGYVKPVLVPGRFVHDLGGIGVVVLRPTND